MELDFKGEKALCLENEKVRIIILPGLGGKIASFYHKEKDFELLFQHKDSFYKQPTLFGEFAAFDASGFDECFPNIDKSREIYGNREVVYPDHGDLWFRQFDYKIVHNQVVMKVSSDLLDYTFIKKVSLLDETMVMEYEIHNTGKFVIEGFYTSHCLINCYEDMVIHLPDEVNEILNVVGGSMLGDEGQLHSYPVAWGTDGREVNLKKVQPSSANKCEKFYVAHPIKTGRCKVEYPHKGIIHVMEYDTDKLPYLGLWLSEGGFRGDYNCALEPSTGYYDSMDKARRNGAFQRYEPNTVYEFTISMSLMSVL